MDELDLLLDGIHRATGLTDGDDGGLLQVLLCQALYRRGHGRREQRGDTRTTLPNHRLAINVHLCALVFALHSVGRQLVQDEGEVDLETEVDHTVGFIHDDVPALREDDDMTLNDILETTGGGDDNLGARP